MSQREIRLEPYPEETARRVAYILGEASAAAKALAQLERRRAAGEDVALFKSGGFILVGPPLPLQPAVETLGSGHERLPEGR